MHPVEHSNQFFSPLQRLSRSRSLARFCQFGHRFRIQRYLVVPLFTLSLPHATSFTFWPKHPSQVSFPKPAFSVSFFSNHMNPKAMDNSPTEPSEAGSTDGPLPSARRKRSSSSTAKDTNSDKKRRGVSKKDNVPSGASGNDVESSLTSDTKSKKAVSHQVLTDRDDLPKLWNDDLAKKNGSYSEF